MRFETSPELRLFADSVRAAVSGWEPPLEPVFGTWWDEHDAALATRVSGVGFAELWAGDDLLGAAVAGGIELGRTLAPLSLVDAATLGGALAVGGRARHLASQEHEVVVVTSGELRCGAAVPGEHEATIDGTGTVRVGEPAAAVLLEDGEARLRAWVAGTLGYLAGLAGRSLDETVAYVRSRQQFGAPLSALPTMQARLADAAVAADGLELLAWESVTAGADGALRRAELRFACASARDVTATAQQAHGGIGFALESGVHCAYRRAKSVQMWSEAVLEAYAGEACV